VATFDLPSLTYNGTGARLIALTASALGVTITLGPQTNGCSVGTNPSFDFNNGVVGSGFGSFAVVSLDHSASIASNDGCSFAGGDYAQLATGSGHTIIGINSSRGVWALVSAVPQGCPVNVIHYPGPPYSNDGSPTTENAIFAPVSLPSEASGFLTGLAAAELACGVTRFNWQQFVTSQTAPSGVFPFDQSLALSSGSIQMQNLSSIDGSLQAPPRYSDPPSGGYKSSDPKDSAYPFYLNSGDLDLLETAYTLSFVDQPSIPPGRLAKGFTTSLVGVLPSGLPSAPLFTWTWVTTFDGTIGGLIQNKSTTPAVPGSGTGGVTITSINGVQLPPAVSSGQLVMTASGLAYSRVSQTFNGTVTIKNVSSSAVNGPLQIVFFGTPAGVTLANATGNLSGTPYITVPAVASLPSGQSATAAVQFKNPSNAILNLTPVIYSGSIN
jgi:hypothetical protein